MGQRILVIDDSRTICRIVEWAFFASSFRVEAVGTAAEAMPRLADSPPDVILLDYHLPDAATLDLVRRFRQDDRLRHTALVVMGGSFHGFDAAEAERLRQAGVDGVVTKPFQTDALNDAVSSALANAVQRASAPVAPAFAAEPVEEENEALVPPPPSISMTGRMPEYTPAQAEPQLELDDDGEDDRLSLAPFPVQSATPIAAVPAVPPARTTPPLPTARPSRPEPPEPGSGFRRVPPVEPGAMPASALGGTAPAPMRRPGVVPPPAPLRAESRPAPPEPLRTAPEPLRTAPRAEAVQRPSTPTVETSTVEALPEASAPARASDDFSPVPTRPAAASQLDAENDAPSAPPSSASAAEVVAATVDADTLRQWVREDVAASVREMLPGLVKELVAGMLKQTNDRMDAYSKQRVDAFCRDQLPKLAEDAVLRGRSSG